MTKLGHRLSNSRWIGGFGAEFAEPSNATCANKLVHLTGDPLRSSPAGDHGVMQIKEQYESDNIS
jgi:hypothetical protein